MMAHGHFMDRCECGIILRQCRCMNPAKTVNVIRPCVHTGPIGMAQSMANPTPPVEDEVAVTHADVEALPPRIAVNERYIGEGMMVGVCGLCCALIWPGVDAAGKHVRSAHGGVLVE